MTLNVGSIGIRPKMEHSSLKCNRKLENNEISASRYSASGANKDDERGRGIVLRNAAVLVRTVRGEGLRNAAAR